MIQSDRCNGLLLSNCSNLGALHTSSCRDLPPQHHVGNSLYYIPGLSTWNFGPAKTFLLQVDFDEMGG